MASANANLHKAKDAKNDEFYTQLTDVAKELMHYKAHFKDKIVLCNCDDPTCSAFWKYFHLNFAELGLKKLISTHYDKTEPTYKMEYSGGDDNDIEVGVKTPLEGNGDFRNKECLDLLDECDIVVTNPPFSCYSSDTEVMTNHGWKLIKDVNIDKDIIMSLNPDNKHIEMVKAVDFISSPVNGELYHFHNENMDFCVTGNHRMYGYYKTSAKENKSLPFINAEEVKKSHLLPLSNFSWQGVQEKYFYLPETTQIEQYSRREIVVPEKKIAMNDWLEFFGFYLADGCYRDHINTCGKRDYTVSIKQNRDNEDYVLDLINRIGFTATISSGSSSSNANYCIYSKQLWEYLSQFGRSEEKYIPRKYMELDKEQLAILLKGYMNGDSSKCVDGHIHFSSVSNKLMDNIQELLLKVYGLITQIHEYERKHSYDDNNGVCYHININLNRYHKNFSKYGVPDKVSYNDNVYCLTLEKNHVMLVRHNGIIGWCGNCFREYVAALMEHEKKFIILGSNNAITYKEIFPLLRDDKMWLGALSWSAELYFGVPKAYEKILLETKKEGSAYKWIDGEVRARAACMWYTNLDLPKRHEKLILWKNYTPEEYPKYDNYDAINVGKVSEIPCDYDGVMGVPISFLDKYNPEQFEIVAFRKGDDGKDLVFTREREREFNRTFVSLYDVDSRDDKKCRRKNQWEAYLCENNNQTEIEPIDYFYPLSIKSRAAGTMNGLINGKETYRRILIRQKGTN